MGYSTKRRICFLIGNYESSQVIQTGVKFQFGIIQKVINTMTFLSCIKQKDVYLLRHYGSFLSLSFLDTHYLSSLLYIAILNYSKLKH